MSHDFSDNLSMNLNAFSCPCNQSHLVFPFGIFVDYATIWVHLALKVRYEFQDQTLSLGFFFRWLLLWNKSRSSRSIKASITEETLSAQITRCKNARRTRQCTKQHGYLFSWIICHFWSRSRCMSGDAPELTELIKYRPFVWHEESKNMSVIPW